MPADDLATDGTEMTWSQKRELQHWKDASYIAVCGWNKITFQIYQGWEKIQIQSGSGRWSINSPQGIRTYNKSPATWVWHQCISSSSYNWLGSHWHIQLLRGRNRNKPLLQGCGAQPSSLWARGSGHSGQITNLSSKHPITLRFTPEVNLWHW